MPPKKSKKLPPLPTRLLTAYLESLPPSSLQAINGPADLPVPVLLAAVGVVPPQLQVEGLEKCAYRWKQDGGNLKVSKKPVAKGKGKGKTGCSEGRCCEDPRCLNWLGQEKWDDDEDALKAFRKAAGLGRDPGRDDRDASTPVGLRNLAATCYINSLLQCWFQDLPFRAAVYACTLSPECKVEDSPLFQLQTTFAALQNSTKAVYDPTKLVESLKLDTGEQQDAQEFAKLFMNLLDREFRRQTDLSVKSLVTDKFEGKLKYGTQCKTCLVSSERPSGFLELEVTLAKKCTLESRLEAMLASETLDGDNQYMCGNCGKLRDAVRYTELVSLPLVLHINLLRFTFDFETMERQKSTNAIEFPLAIDMSKFVGPQHRPGLDDDVDRPGDTGPTDGGSTDSGDEVAGLWYDLKGVLLHKGGSAYHGHYVAQVFDVSGRGVANSQNKWFVFDDETVSPLTHFDENDANVTTTNLEPDKKPPVKRTYGTAKTKHAAPKKTTDPGRTSTKDAYMLIYARRPAHTSSSTKSSSSSSSTIAAPELGIHVPDPPPLAEAAIENQNSRHTERKAKYQSGLASLELDFAAARAARKEVWQSLEPGEGEPVTMAPRENLERWMCEGLQKITVAKEPSPKPKEPPSNEDTDGDTTMKDVTSTAKNLALAANGNGKSDADDELPSVESMLKTEPVAEPNLWIPSKLPMCKHNQVDPRDAHDLKIISQYAAIAISTYKAEERMRTEVAICDIDAVCRECVWSLVADVRYSTEHSQRVVEFGSLGTDGVGYHISKQWFLEWLKPTSDIIRIEGTINDRSPGDEPFYQHVFCDHGDLQSDPKLTYQLSTEGASFFQGLFPDWNTLNSASIPCRKCTDKMNIESNFASEAKAVAAAEKTQLKRVFMQKRSATLIEESTYAVVPPSWHRQWKAWIADAVHEARPASVDNSRFICKHGELLIDLSSEIDYKATDRICLLQEADWRKVKVLYPDSGPEITFTLEDANDHLKVCRECRDFDRSVYEEATINIRVLDTKAYEPLVPGQYPVKLDNLSRSESPPIQIDLEPGTSRKRKQNSEAKRGSVKTLQVVIEKLGTVKNLKVCLQQENMLNIPTIYQHLYRDGRELDNVETMEDLKITAYDTFEVFCDSVDDDEVDVSNLKDAVGSVRRNGRVEGFAGSGLVGFESLDDLDKERLARPPDSTDSTLTDVEGACDEGWTCEVCTFHNESRTKQCAVCCDEY